MAKSNVSFALGAWALAGKVKMCTTSVAIAAATGPDWIIASPSRMPQPALLDSANGILSLGELADDIKRKLALPGGARHLNDGLVQPDCQIFFQPGTALRRRAGHANGIGGLERQQPHRGLEI